MTLQEILKLRRPGFTDDIGVAFTSLTDGCCEGRIKVENRHLNPRGTVHGGCVFTLMDSVGGVAALARGEAVTTSSSNVLFLNPAVNTEYVYATAKPIKRGRTLQVYDVEATDDNGRVVAKANFTYFTLGKLET